MIGKIKGTLIEVDGKEGLIDTASGLCYRVILTPRVLSSNIPSTVDIYTHLQIREDAQVLYGFDSHDQFRMFQKLLTVDGVGPKTAHGVIAHLPVEDIINAVQTKDISIFTAVPGLGKKTAQKIILEFSGKLKAEFDVSSIIDTPVDNEAVDALVALGYRVNEAREMLKNIDPNLPVEQKIRLALRKHE